MPPSDPHGAGHHRCVSSRPLPHRACGSPAHAAPRGALLYPRRSRDELEGGFLGLMAYPDPKGERNNRMPGKRRSGSDVRAEASRDPCDKAKAELLEAQSPDDERERPPERHPIPAPCPATASRVRPTQPSGRGALPSEGNQGDEWDAYVTLGRMTATNAGSPTGREPHGHGVPIVVVPAPRGAMRKEMKDIKHLVRAGWNAGPGLMQRPGEAGDGQGVESRVRGQASRQRDGRVALPDARVRASKTER